METPVKYNVQRELISMVRMELMIGDIKVLAFMDANGKYYMHSDQTAKLVGKKGNEIESYIVQNALNSQSSGETFSSITSIYRKGLEQSSAWDPTLFVVCSSSQPYRVLPIKDVVDFIWHQMEKGNQAAKVLAYALMHESLEIRCESLFVGTSPNVQDIQAHTDHWLSNRSANKSVHGAFHQYCNSNGIAGNHAHDRMTIKVFGQTAKQAILDNPLIGTDEHVGLDHQENAAGQLLIAKMKVKFMGYKKGTWIERVERAYLESI
jgi:hypothetical protein